MGSSTFELKVFWESADSKKLSQPLIIEKVLSLLEQDDATLYELTFYGSFAERMLGLMRREGKDVDGFERMQQSFRESVDVVRRVLGRLAAAGLYQAEPYLAVESASFERLLLLIGDLAIVKSWMLSQGQSTRSDSFRSQA